MGLMRYRTDNRRDLCTMQVIRYLNSVRGETILDDLSVLEGEFNIGYSMDTRYPELIVLNYDQIKSPKHHPIVTECRSLVLERLALGDWKVVSRSFDRFFNYGETDCGYNANYLVANEKMDGSLIGLFFYHKYGWLYRTKSMIMPESTVMGFPVTWKDIIEDGMGSVPYEGTLKTGVTYIQEVTAPENRIVTRYEDRKITLLAARYDNGVYMMPNSVDDVAKVMKWCRPKTWTFSTMAECAQGAKDLRDLNEGYVMYDRLGAPVCKVKNPAYVAAHHLRGEGVLTPRRVMDLVLMNETDEYLSIFPEDTRAFTPYINALQNAYSEASRLWAEYGEIEDNKEFALKVKDYPVFGLLFNRRNGRMFVESVNRMTSNARYNLIKAYLKEV